MFNGKIFQSRNGLLDLVMEDLQADGSEPIYAPLHYAEKTLEFCFTHSNSRYRRDVSIRLSMVSTPAMAERT